ncbi:hypothetical protein [Aneurinibacillus aneurinilyticus]|uniref:hypothetical protein n=1 Tax=Aneurinibacillus aneurinilyticus TaxID=1391 RepID=UPI00352544D1
MIIQYDPEWIVTTPCPKRAAVRPPHPSSEGRFLPQPGGTAKHLGKREEEDSCRPFSPGRGMRSGRETKGLVCVPLWWPFPLWTINTLGVVGRRKFGKKRRVDAPSDFYIVIIL